MDARNWLNEDYIFAFEGLTYDANTQNIDGVQEILKGTFMDVQSITYIDTAGNTQVINKSYAQIIMEAAQEYNVSAYHLASRLRQEQGAGNSGLISGNFTYTDPETGEYHNYVGYYNYFNINASGSTTEKIIVNGLKYASSDRRAFKWTTPELAIKGGAQFLANNYIEGYQDNIYLQKYCVDSASGSLYSNQYMQNISAPYTEGNYVRNAYEEINVINYSFNFVIPVYENMPQEICKRPANDTTIVTENVQTTASYLRIRTGPSTDYTAISSVPNGTILLRIEKANKLGTDSKYWDKIVYNTGTEIIIGYAARDYLIDIEDIVSVNEQDVTRTSVNLRNGPGTSSTTIIKTLSTNTNVTIIDKIPYEINGHIWYRVKLENGTQGYLASTYLKSHEEPTKDPETNYKIEGNYMIIAPTTGLADISGLTSSSENWGTGTIVNLEGVDYNLIVLGDVNGDGKVKANDYVLIKNHIMEISALSEIAQKAANINKDTKISASDYVLIKNYIMSGTPITL